MNGGQSDNQNLHLTIFSKYPDDMSLEAMTAELDKYCEVVNMKRFDVSNEFIEAAFLIEFVSFKELTELKTSLQQLDGESKISFLDNKGIVG